jgi:hydrogenase nickel incorporation protein HypA/HybF
MGAVLEIALNHAGSITDRKVKRIVAIKLQVGQMRDVVDDWMQLYFNHASRGTLADGARLEIQRIPITLQCRDCTTEFTVRMQEVVEAKCPQCGNAQNAMRTGKELCVEGIEVACDG